MSVADTLADIARRNAGEPCLTVWRDGSFLQHGYRDAEQATRCEPGAVLVTIRLDTMDAVEFLSAQRSVDIADMLLATPKGPTEHEQ